MTSRWRLIESGPGNAFFNMALDEALAEGVRAGSGPPTLRLYGWERPSVTLGAFQRSSEADAAYCLENRIPVVRRPTGGRGILHGNELTYGFAAPTARGAFSGGLLASYALLGETFRRAFEMMGIAVENTSRTLTSGRARSPICFRSASHGETTLGGRKIIGSAQRRWPGAMLQQGSIPMTLDYDCMEYVFGGGHGNARDVMAGLCEFVPGLALADIAVAVRASFEERFGIRFEATSPSPREEARARELLETKYLLPEWNHRRQRRGNRR